jgi:hypothetical protein
MNARFLHPAYGANREPARLHDDAMQNSKPVPDQACCCPARAVVRLVMPPTAGRRHRTELLLCGHHYRLSRQALATANAAVSALPGTPESPPVALLPDFPCPRARVG